MTYIRVGNGTEFRDLLYALVRESNDDHRLMLKFIEKRDTVGVEKLVRDHILMGREIVLKEFDMDMV